MKRVIFGVPGAGKTRRVVEEMRALTASGYAPEEILCTSFTRTAAREIVSRAELPADRATTVGTTHSIAWRAVGLGGGDMMGEEDYLAVADDLKLTRTSGAQVRANALFLRARDTVRRAVGLQEPLAATWAREFPQTRLPWALVERVATALRHYKVTHGKHEYDDALELVLREGRVLPHIRAVVVDEAQDTSILHWRVLRQLVPEAEVRIYAGDVDQTVYQMFGARPDILLRQRDAEVIRLEDSHRCRMVVAMLVNGIGRRIPSLERAHADLNPLYAGGMVSRVGALLHAPLDHDDVLVLARTNARLEELRRTLDEAGYVYSWRPPSALEGAISKGRLGSSLTGGASSAQHWYHRLAAGEPQRASRANLVRKYAGLPPLPLGHAYDWATTLPGLAPETPWHAALPHIPRGILRYLRAVERRYGRLDIDMRPSIRLDTIHGAKGGEADVVILDTTLGLNGLFEQRRDHVSETRVWYVGASRARHQLVLLYPAASRWCYRMPT